MNDRILPAIIAALAAYRVARAISRDDISRPLRNKIFRWAFTEQQGDIIPKHRLGAWLFGLTDCPHCVGFWISGLMFGALRSWHGEPIDLAWWFAIAGTQSFLQSMSEKN